MREGIPYREMGSFMNWRSYFTNTIFQRGIKLQEAKQALADDILSGQMGSLMSMSGEELMELLA